MSLGYQGYIASDYIEEDYYEEDGMALDTMPSPPLRSDSEEVFIQKSEAWMIAFVNVSAQLNAAVEAMNNNSTNSTSATSHTIAGTGSKVFTVEPLKSYLPGQSVKAAVTADGTKWMQGDVTAYNPTTGALAITMNAAQGSGTYTAWTLTLATSVANPTGSLGNDFSVKSLTHAIGANIASAATIDLSAATGNLAHVTGNVGIGAATMTSGKDVLVIFDGTPILTYHATNLRLNSGGANITAVAGDRALFAYDGTTVTVTYFKLNGKANVETSPPAGIPAGIILPFAGSTPPPGYLACPTTATNISRTTYAALWNAIGSTFGNGDGSTTFGLPYFPADYAPVQANANVGSASTGTVKAHTHDYASNDNAGSVSTGGSWVNSVGNNNTKTTTSTGGAANLAAGMRVLLCIKY